MKQIITVLAILITGIASAQSNWNVSVCEGELVHDYERYIVLGDLLTENHQGNLPGGRSANTGGWFCLEDLITTSDNYNRYFRWYCNGTRNNDTGDVYTGDRATIRNYSFSNGVVIRIYPGNYADGATVTPPGQRSYRRLGNLERQGWQNMFEVRVFEGGRSALNEDDRFHTSAQSAWNYANR